MLTEHEIRLPLALALAMGLAQWQVWLWLWRGRVSVTWARGITVAGTVVAVSWAAWSGLDDAAQWDLRIYHEAGREILAGVRPYSTEFFEDLGAFNPPPALPFYVALASVSEAVATTVWAIVNAGLLLSLVPLTAWGLMPPSKDNPELESGSDERSWLGPLAVAVTLSASSCLTVQAGQWSALVASAIVAALVLRERGRPGLAGFLLALATIKVQMMALMLPLVLRRKDLRLVLAMGLAFVGVSLVYLPPTDLVPSALRLAEVLRDHAGPGRMNDYTLQSVNSDTLVGIRYTLSCLGLEDRSLIERIDLACFAMAAIGLFWADRRGLRSRSTLVSLACLASSITIYHRTYDLVLLAIPLTCSIVHAMRNDPVGRRRTGWAILSVVLLLAMNAPSGLGEIAETLQRSLGPWSEGPIRILVRPWATWLVLGAIIGLGWLSRDEASSR